MYILFLFYILYVSLLIILDKPHCIINRTIEEIYLKRWFIIPRNPIFNIYLHHFYLSDLDSALHDHPWNFNISIILSGSYKEWIPCEPEKWQTTNRRSVKYIRRYPFIPVIRFGPSIHRIELDTDDNGPKKVWTLFITGQTVSSWGFYCANRKVDHKDYLIHTIENGHKISKIGKGCT